MLGFGSLGVGRRMCLAVPAVGCAKRSERVVTPLPPAQKPDDALSARLAAISSLSLGATDWTPEALEGASCFA